MKRLAATAGVRRTDWRRTPRTTRLVMWLWDRFAATYRVDFYTL